MNPSHANTKFYFALLRKDKVPCQYNWQLNDKKRHEAKKDHKQHKITYTIPGSRTVNPNEPFHFGETEPEPAKFYFSEPEPSKFCSSEPKPNLNP